VSDEAALTRAIIAQPDDDLARLALADWLDEFGTTDQQRARSEWIRLVCWDRGNRAKNAAGKRHRMTGEPTWLRANAHRLWPNLFALHAKWPNHRHTPHLSLLTGRVVVSLAIEIPGDRPGEKRLDFTRVGIDAERGVATGVSVSLLRAALTAPAAATDEPFSPLSFLSLPERCFEFGNGEMYVHSRPFTLRGLRDIWRGAEGGYGQIEGDEVKTYPTLEGQPLSSEPAEAALNASLTRWARQASNRLAFGVEEGTA
jgi:uncharacterized protein (TIGR02996 family)